MAAIVRINSLTINNIKCVKHGLINFKVSEDLRDEKASVMGIYGQNGSGKTVVVEALSILKALFSGERISDRYLDSIANGENSASIYVELKVIEKEHTDYTAFYQCELEQRIDPNENDKSFIAVVSESLEVSGLINGTRFRKQTVAQTNENEKLLSPKDKQKLLFGSNRNELKKLEQDKLLAFYGSRSFIFSNSMLEASSQNSKHEFKTIMSTIRFFAIVRLFVVGGETQQDIPFPIYFVNEDAAGGSLGLISFSFNSISVISDEVFSELIKAIPSLNTALQNVIPGLRIDYKSRKVSLDEDSDDYEVELFAEKDSGVLLPLRHESLGTKKIVSFLSLFIAAYNNPKVVLVVDEFDSSIFEFLLGELVSVINTTGKGQFIFTSHNLRPLEKLGDESICFTTTDPMDRYKTVKIKATNNLRDVYFRLISLGDDNFELYNGESKNALAYAFWQAGGGAIDG
ncbi:MAG: ATP-binding protein [Oscillospiraceae bacterium]|nr:ATP-binding protein [Oscillospiraceae bacterium]